MKVIAVLGSPAKNGNTCVLAREVLRGANESGAEIEEIFLADFQIEFCKGCVGKSCIATGNCIIKDDVNILKQKLYQSDGIVLASPAYGTMETARMKNFLVDRIGMYTAYISGLGGKYFVGVSTCGGIGAKKVAKNLSKHFLAGFHKRGYMTGYIGVKLGYDRVEQKVKDLQYAYNLGKKLVEDIRKNKKYLFQKLFDRVMISLFVKRIILKNIYSNKDGVMKAVYENLIKRKLIKQK